MKIIRHISLQQPIAIEKMTVAEMQEEMRLRRQRLGPYRDGTPCCGADSAHPSYPLFSVDPAPPTPP